MLIPETIRMKIQIILGSKSDMPVAEKIKKILDGFTIKYDIKIAKIPNI